MADSIALFEESAAKPVRGLLTVEEFSLIAMLSLAVLPLVLLLSILTGVNAGLLSLVAAGMAASMIPELSFKEVAAGFPGDLFFLLLGILLLLSVAQRNGSIDWVVARIVSSTGGRLSWIPIVFFFVALFSSSLGPGAAPLLFVAAAGLAHRYGISYLLLGAMVIHGNQAGNFSPIAPYGVLFSILAGKANLVLEPTVLYLNVVFSHLMLGAAVYLLLGGRKLGRVDPSDLITPAEDVAGGTAILPIQLATLIGFVLLLLVVVFTDINLGVIAMGVASLLLIFSPRKEREEAVAGVAWQVILIVCGVTTYVGILEHMGALAQMGDSVRGVANSSMIALILGWMSAFLTGIASTFGTLSMILPISATILAGSNIDVTAFFSMLAIASAVTDVSPVSPYGALYVASCVAADRARVFKQLLIYACFLAVVVPVLCWLLLLGQT